MNETGVLFDQFVAPGVTYSEIAVMPLEMATRHVAEMRAESQDDLPFHDEDIARVVISYAQRCLGARLLTAAERLAFPGQGAPNVAVLQGHTWVYGLGKATDDDPTGLSDVQPLTDEGGACIEVRSH